MQKYDHIPKSPALKKTCDFTIRRTMHTSIMFDRKCLPDRAPLGQDINAKTSSACSGRNDREWLPPSTRATLAFACKAYRFCRLCQFGKRKILRNASRPQHAVHESIKVPCTRTAGKAKPCGVPQALSSASSAAASSNMIDEIMKRITSCREPRADTLGTLGVTQYWYPFSYKDPVVEG